MVLLWFFVQSLLVKVSIVELWPMTGVVYESATWEAANSKEITKEDLIKAQEYIDRFYNAFTVSRRLSSPTEEKIKAMQTFFALNITGKINKETLQVMRKPRCGVPDVQRFSHFPGKPKWEKTSLTYRIVNYTPDITNSEVDYAIAQAFRLWSEITPLNFRQIYSGEGDIMISFGYRDHGDFFPFDGPLGILAHAFAPGNGIGGDAHFDEEEKWTLGRQGFRFLSGNNSVVDCAIVSAKEMETFTERRQTETICNGSITIEINGNGSYGFHLALRSSVRLVERSNGTHEQNPNAGTNIFLVALHELGHALGLEHSRYEKAIMYPTLLENSFVDPTKFKLFKDDIEGIQALYGRRIPNVPKPNPTVKLPPGPTKKPQPKPPKQPQPKPPKIPESKPPKKPQPKPTKKPESKPTRKPQAKPKPTKESKPVDVPKYPTKCDRELKFDAITSMRGDLLFFKEGIIWRKSLTKSNIDTISLNATWPNLQSVDAAYEVPQRDIVYLFKGRHFWITRGFTMVRDYPQDISQFGFPSSVKKIDAALFLKEDRKAIFFVRDKYWSYDHVSLKMDSKVPRKIKRGFPGIGKIVDAAFQDNDHLYFSEGANQIEYNPRRKLVVRKTPNYRRLNCN